MSGTPVVCDNGTGFVKCGWAGTNFPLGTFPSMVGRPLLTSNTKLDKTLRSLPEIVVGADAEKYREYLELSYPMDSGIIKKWDEMKLLWDHTFRDIMGIDVTAGHQDTSLKDPGDHKILLTEAPGNPKKNRVNMYKRMFEVYGFHSCYVAVQAVLVLYAQGLVTGVVLDSGDGVSHVIPVFEGFGMPNLVKRLNVAGRHVTTNLVKLLQLRGYNMNKTADFDTVRQIKERLCYIAYDPEVERELALSTTALVDTYKLPDGRKITIGRERYEAGEALFDPMIVDVSGQGMHQMLFSSIQQAPMDLRPEFYKHIVLSGGTTMFRGLPSRLEREIKNLWLNQAGKDVTNAKARDARYGKLKVKIEDPPRRKNMVYIGGAVLSDIMKDKPEFWVTKADWDENGEKCLSRFGWYSGR